MSTDWVGIFKQHSVNKIAFIVLRGELVCSGKRVWRRWWEEYLTLRKRVSSASSASKGMCINRMEPPKLGSVKAPSPCVKGVTID